MSVAAGRALRAVTGEGETLTYAAIAGLGGFAALYGRQYGMTAEEGQVGPGMVPVIAGVLLCLLGLALLARHLRNAEGRATTGGSDAADVLGRTDADRVRHLWVVFGLLFLSIELVVVLGLVVAFGLFVLLVFVAVERRSVLPSAVVAIGACAFIQVVFGTLLRVPLPQGIFGA